jgi:hypothetical protein
MSVSRHARVAGNDAPLIDERAATRGRCAMEGRDERAGVTREPAPASRTGSSGGTLDALAAPVA